MKPAWPANLGHFHLESVDSTSAEAWRRVRTDTPPPFWISADQQTQAKGRRGRQWHAPKGNFMASVMVAPGKDARDAALRSFTMSLALYDALSALGVDAGHLALKWPNDVLFKSAKLAGILLESQSTADAIQLCIGVGVNLASSPEQTELESAALAPASLGGSVKASDLLAHLAVAFDYWENRLENEGFAAIRIDWLTRAVKIGEIITARLPNEQHRGIFETVDETGALVLKTPDKTLHLHAAEVFF